MMCPGACAYRIWTTAVLCLAARILSAADTSLDLSTDEYLVEKVAQSQQETPRAILQTRDGYLWIGTDGAEAVAAFARQRPDWTIMDINMQGMNRLEATRRIQKQFADSRIVMLTQHDTPQMRAAALQAGACAFISKDNLAELGAILRNP